MRAFLTKNFIPAMLALVVFLVTLPFIESVIRIYKKYTPAIHWVSGKAITPVVKAGEVLKIVYNAQVYEQCPSELRSFLRASDGTVPVRFPLVYGGYTPVSDGPVDVKVSIEIPDRSDPGLANLASGFYEYSSMAIRYCEDEVEHDYDIPKVKFYLEVGNAAQREIH